MLRVRSADAEKPTSNARQRLGGQGSRLTGRTHHSVRCRAWPWAQTSRCGSSTTGHHNRPSPQSITVRKTLLGAWLARKARLGYRTRELVLRCWHQVLLSVPQQWWPCRRPSICRKFIVLR